MQMHMQIELSGEESTLLRRVLDAALKELRVEVRRTETRSMHDELKQDEGRIRGLLDKLGGTGDSS